MKNLPQAIKKINEVNYQKLTFYPIDDLKRTIQRESSIKIRTKQLVSVMTPVFLLSACGGSGSGLKKPNSNNTSSDTSSSNNASSDNLKSNNANSDNSSFDNSNSNNASSNTSNSNTSNSDNSSSDNSNSDNSNSDNSSSDNSSSDNQQASNNQSNTHNSNTSITKEAAARFLLQAQFSSTMDEIQYVQNIGYEAWIDEQLSMDENISETVTEWLDSGKVKASYLATHNAHTSQRMMWSNLFNCEDTLRKRVTLMLSEIYVITAPHFKFSYRNYCAADYWDMLNRMAFGNVRDLLSAVSGHVAMGLTLDILGSRKAYGNRQPDENFARELMQLMTIGVEELNIDGSLKLDAQGNPIETYDLDDVQELARVFTGYNKPGGRQAENTKLTFGKKLDFDPHFHDFGEKKIFGQTLHAITDESQQTENTAIAEREQALDILFNHDNIAPFLSKQFIQRFVTSNPSPAYITRVAETFNGHGQYAKERGNIGATIKAVLLDREAREIVERDDPRYNIMGKGREPMLMLCQWAKTFAQRETTAKNSKIKSESGKWRLNNSKIGQVPMGSRTVFNFFRPGDAPKDKDFRQYNLVAPELYLVDTNKIMEESNYLYKLTVYGLGVMLEHRESIAKSIEVKADLSDLIAMQDNPHKVVDYLNLVMCAGSMRQNTKDCIVEAIELIFANKRQRNFDNVVAGVAVFMTMMSPEFRILK